MELFEIAISMGDLELKKILFFIHDLGPGGAEKVLVNLVNNMDPEQYNITVMTLVDGGVNRQFLKPHIRYLTCFQKLPRGHTQLMKLWSARQLHKQFIKEKYDIELAYLEGPAARVISGCPHQDTKLVSWIHCTPTEENLRIGFRSLHEARKTYEKFDNVVCVSSAVERLLRQNIPSLERTQVLFNTNDSNKILKQASEPAEDWNPEGLRLVTVGKIIPVKAFDRLIRIHARLRQEGYAICTSILGVGSQRAEMEALCQKLNVADTVCFLGYQTNPYKYIANSDLYVCSSLSEGFSTAATEALIAGTPVCTVEVSGMKEMLGENNEYGVVTENDEEALYQGIKRLLDDPALLEHYKEQAQLRGKDFSTENTVKAVEEMLLSL